MTDNNNKIRVLIVDDSTFVRRLVSDILKQHPDIMVVGQAMNGRMAINMLDTLKPDVITLDVEMPFMNGLETLKKINEIRPTPTIMLSSLTAAGAEVTIEALELGAVDFLQKPADQSELDSIGKELIEKILHAKESFKKRQTLSAASTPKTQIPTQKTTRKVTRVKTVVIGSSTGGPQSLKEVMPYIPADLPAQFLMVQHMPATFTALFAERLNKLSKITIKEATDGDEMKAQQALLAPGNYHMGASFGNKIKLNQDPSMWGVRPAVDVTLATAAQVYKEDLICVILTGMGRDGTEGAGVVKKYGGYVIAQDEATSIIYGMPKCVAEAGHADEIVPLQQVAQAIVNAVYR